MKRELDCPACAEPHQDGQECQQKPWAEFREYLPMYCSFYCPRHRGVRNALCAADDCECRKSATWIDTIALQAATEITALPEIWPCFRRKAAIQVIVAREMMKACSLTSQHQSTTNQG